MRNRQRLSIVLTLSGAIVSAVAHAEETPPDTPETTVSPPRLLDHVEASLPEGRTSTTPVAVPLEIEIGEDGAVRAVRALDGAPPELASIAVEAVRGFRFEPAKQGDRAIAVVIDYVFWFPANREQEPVLVAPAPMPAPAESPPKTPVGGASPEDEGVHSDAEPEFEAVAEVEAPPREPTRRTLPREVLAKTPGTRGDPIRAVEVLPGVARAPMGSNPILRGAAGHESETYLDGVRIPQLYHFGGITSVVHPALLGDVSLYASNFSARYGRATGGIIEAELRSPRSDGLHGLLDLNLIDTSVLVEGPLATGLSGAAAFRRSNIDLVFEALASETDSFNVVAAPLYWDYQVLAEYQPSARGTFRVTATGSRDSLKFIFSEPPDQDPTLRGELSGSLEYHTLTLGYEHQRDGFAQSYQVSIGRDLLRQHVGPFVAYFDGIRTAARAEWGFGLSDSLELIAGLDHDGTVLTGAYRGPPAPSQEGSLDQPDGATRLLVVDELTVAQLSPALYTEARWFPTDRWLIVPGFRADYYQDLDAITLNPRLGQRYTLSEDWTLKAGVGAYSQRPVYYESMAEVGNPDIQPYHALHTSLGAERKFGDVLTVDGEVFYKHLYERVVSAPGGAPPHFINDGEGQIYGLETQARFTPDERWFGQLSYTLSRSERQDRDEPTRLFDYDQTHVLNAALGVNLGAGWEVGGRFRFISGNPQTPVTSAVYDARTGIYQPRYGEQGSVRDPAFHQLDLRVDKRFPIGSGAIGAYLEILNVYNQENAEGYDYNFDYSERTRVTGMPFFPNLGIKGEL
jgi:hypothetical protein